jgi:molybdate transport system regulatory protein
MLTQEKTRPVAKIWLEYKGEPLLGKGGAEILEAVKKKNSITKAAKASRMSYRYVWNYLDRTKKVLNEPLVITVKGGKGGGGGAKLTPFGESLLKDYQHLEDYVGEILGDEEYWEAVGLRISARNRLKSVVKSVEKDKIVAKVRMEITSPVTITAVISTEAVEDLNIKAGDKVEAVIKGTEIMVAKEK